MILVCTLPAGSRQLLEQIPTCCNFKHWPRIQVWTGICKDWYLGKWLSCVVCECLMCLSVCTYVSELCVCACVRVCVCVCAEDTLTYLLTWFTTQDNLSWRSTHKSSSYGIPHTLLSIIPSLHYGMKWLLMAISLLILKYTMGWGRVVWLPRLFSTFTSTLSSASGRRSVQILK